MAAPEIAGYTIERLLGRGGFASVHLATRHADGRRVAIKVLFEHVAETDALVRFERERLSMTALSAHPHIVDVLDGGTTDDGQHYLVLEYLPAGSIKDRLQAEGAIPWADAIAIGIQISSALDAAHRIGVLHRDCKPANIFMGPDGAKLGDFGIARLVGSTDVTAVESIIGTLAYTPPEILRSGAFDGRGDIYQLGVTLYEMLLGRPPFTSGSSDSKAVVMRRILEDPAPSLAQFDVPVPLSDLLDEVLAKDPADRPQTAAELGRRLGNIGSGPDPTVRIPSPIASDDDTSTRPTPADTPGRAATIAPRPAPSPSAAPTRRRRRGIAVLAGVLVSAAVAAGLLTNSLRDGSTGDPGDGGPPIEDPELEMIDTPAFASPAGSNGVVFGAVANSAGLTAVGGAGDGEGVDSQRGVVWTMDADGSWAHQSGFAASTLASNRQRLRDVAVLDGVRLLTVGEDASGSSIDGTAWLGLTVARMEPTAYPGFVGTGRQSLLGAAGDAERQQFIVVGERTGPSGPRPGLWVLEAGADWFDPVWSAVPTGLEQLGRLTDVAVEGDVAVASGHIRTGTTTNGVLLIRRRDSWSSLIAPVADTELTSVDVAADRVVAVGTRIRDDVSEPIAVVSDLEGTGFVHRLPLDEVSGRAADVATTSVGTYAVGSAGETAGDEAFDSGRSDGVIWRLVPGDEMSTDRWQHLAVEETRATGFQEFWTVVEFDGAIVVLGRAEDETGRRPASGWILSAELTTSPA